MRDREFLPAVVVFYGLLAAAAFAWMWLRDEPLRRLLAPGRSAGLGLEVAVGVGFGAAVVGIGHLVERRFEFARRLTADIRELLPELSTLDVVGAAVFSSVAEELFFRGAMQDAIGFWITAAIFAIVHGFFERRFLAWMAFAAVVGLALGAMTLWLGTLLAPILAHFTINALNLHKLAHTSASP